ncbi:hypothetical protein [Pedobacter metabolipauper]|uniref:Protein involved in gliding motility RemB n=1 Tax=Pedobacter metabolipauper TaxID=425513 RepID=A0A4R6SYZ7_9SPHI|nr:hypothetical protein [Pedobacter metabolipauper]TDQ09914.1 hypothetical protein ATK78_2073 [Pedobacter metabolipauper]
MVLLLKGKPALYLKLLVLLVIISTSQGYTQSQLFPLGKDLQLKLGRSIYFDSLRRNHASLQSYFTSEIGSDSLSQDSLLKSLYPERKAWQRKNWIFRKLFTEHLIEVVNPDYTFNLDFIPDFQIGKQGDNNLWLNTRGIELSGTIGKQFAFTSYFYENQGQFADYYTAYSFTNRVVPGQGRVRAYGDTGLDYNYSGGSISYTPSKYVNFQLGYDKNFIGDGYRSLLLSDNAFNYPFVKVTATLGQVRFMAMYAQFMDIYEDRGHEELGLDSPYPKKYGIFHYLSWNATRRLSLGFYENVMWYRRVFEFGYIPPLVFSRPTEFANGSPDKVVMGLNGSYKIADRYVAYGQFILNEFSVSDLFAGNGSWKNKYGMQGGIKGFDIFKVSGLNAQLEMNRVRPYTYSALEHFKNYGHYNQPLAHPYGANFKEYLAIAGYRYHNFDLRVQLTAATYGLDVNGLNYGKNIYLPYDTRVSDEGNFIGQGLKTNLLFADVKLAYILNPKNNLRIELGYAHRNEKNSLKNDTQQIVNIGLKASFRNLYSDF